MILGNAATVFDIPQDIPRTYVGRWVENRGFFGDILSPNHSTHDTSNQSSKDEKLIGQRSDFDGVGEDGDDHKSVNLSIALEHVLRAYCYYRPDVGYIQGMSYLAGHLLLYMDEYTAFVAFGNLLSKPFLRSFYMTGTVVRDHMESRLMVFDHVAKSNLPKLYVRLKELEVPLRMYFFQWSLTMFGKVFPFETLARVWQGYLVEGEVYLYRVGTALLKILEPTLSKCSLKTVYETLQNPCDGKIEESVLCKALIGITVSTTVEEQFNKLQATQQISAGAAGSTR
mmetsp:Transcript_15795/g.32140  ORF Transcript_15795/g.32140 Transcript_15795/m.32140 type:complete len:284 (+) Transcript_15795:165-1016(+)